MDNEARNLLVVIADSFAYRVVGRVRDLCA